MLHTYLVNLTWHWFDYSLAASAHAHARTRTHTHDSTIKVCLLFPFTGLNSNNLNIGFIKYRGFKINLHVCSKNLNVIWEKKRTMWRITPSMQRPKLEPKTSKIWNRNTNQRPRRPVGPNSQGSWNRECLISKLKSIMTTKTTWQSARSVVT